MKLYNIELQNNNVDLQTVLDTVRALPDANSGTDTSDATATAEDILIDKTAYVNGIKIAGVIPSLGASIYTPSTSDQVIEAGQYLNGEQTVEGDANLVAENIKSGVIIFGVEGNVDAKTEEITVKITNSGSSARYCGYSNNGVPKKVTIAKSGSSTITVRKGELITLYCSSLGDSSCTISSVEVLSPSLTIFVATIPISVTATSCTLTIT